MKNSKMFRIVRAAAGVLLALPLLAPLPLATLEGKWKLVEQQYGSGKANLVSLDAPVRLEFFTSGPGLAGRLWSAKDRSKAVSWPALIDDPPRRLEIREVTILPESNLARAVYRIRPVSPEGEVVEVVEEYRMSQEGALLIGTVRVSAIGDAGPGGSYVLRRRFEREP